MKTLKDFTEQEIRDLPMGEQLDALVYESVFDEPPLGPLGWDRIGCRWEKYHRQLFTSLPSEVSITVKRHGESVVHRENRTAPWFSMIESAHVLCSGAVATTEMHARALAVALYGYEKQRKEAQASEVPRFYDYLRQQFQTLDEAKAWMRHWRFELGQVVPGFGSFTFRAMAFHASNVLEGKTESDLGITSYASTRYGSELYWAVIAPEKEDE